MNEPADRIFRAMADRYRVERPLGQGGMATVFLAHDLRNERDVAIKVLRHEVAASLGSERFRREIHVIARLQHPFVLPLLDSGEVDGAFYSVMPYLPEGSLRGRLDRERELPLDDALRVLREIAGALAHAHGHGVVHRDLKPENVLFSGGHAQLADFGVARVLEGHEPGTALTTAGVAIGTPQYMAPEQAAGDPKTDHRADLYAFGVLAYEILTGGPPFMASSPAQLVAMHRSAEPEPIARRRPALPDELAELVMRCLQKRPADRCQSAADLRTTLRRISESRSAATSRTQAVGTTLRRLPITESVVRRLSREYFDPRMIGDELDYLDNQMSSDVMILLLNATWLDRADFEPHLRLLPYRCLVPDYYGFGSSASHRFPMPLRDHIAMLAELLHQQIEEARPSIVLVCGFSASADVALQIPRMMAERGRPVDGVLALGPNQSLETCFISRVLAKLEDNDPDRLLAALKDITGGADALDDWMLLNGYMGRIIAKFRSDLGPLRILARDIVAPFEQDDAGAFAAMYRDATQHARRVRCTFEESEICQRHLKAALVSHMDHGTLGERHRDGSLLVEPTPSHLELPRVERVAPHLAAMIEELRSARD